MSAPARPLEGLRIVITGRLASMRREEAQRLVEQAGGRTLSGVSSRTDLLVVGMEGWPLLPDGTPSRKLQAAERLRRAGHGPEIISERRFLERLGLREPAAERQGSCSLAQAAQILGVEEARLDRWRQFGLIHTDERGQLPYRELVSLRQIAALLEQGVPLRRLVRTLEGLRRLLQVEQPLSQLRVLERRGELLAELEGVRINLAGQIELFDQETAPAPGPAELEAWFDFGADCEEEGRWLQAEAAYRRVLQLDPGFAEAHFNLGNILRGRGQLAAAAEAYRRAAEHAAEPPLKVAAFYNLAYVLDEQGLFAPAAQALQQCLELDAHCADACFNLAMCYERLQQHRQAAEMWRRYLRLDPDSEWARTARRHLFVVQRALGPPPPRQGV